MITIIICTYKRTESLKVLLDNLEQQKRKPDELLIIDGSPDGETETMVHNLKNSLQIYYWNTPPEHRGLTRQRNFGIAKLRPETDIVCFLDDDVILEPDYLKILEGTLNDNPGCVGVSGYQTTGRKWDIYNPTKHTGKKWYIMDGFAIKLGDRNYLRRLLGLFPEERPGFFPKYGHVYEIVPPSGKSYEAEHLIGCNMSFRRMVFDKVKFSDFFIGYGLYEDFDFSLRTTQYGYLLVNTNMRLEHHHHPAGRPNTYKYGKMVTRNGWYVWRMRYEHPGFINVLKWYTISILFTLLIVKSFRQKSAVMEFLGRVVGLFSLIFSPPHIER